MTRRRAGSRYDWQGLFEAMGLRFGWCRRFGDWVRLPQYWPARVRRRRPRRRAPALRRLRYFAGCRDWTRGRHWDRRRRYGVK